MSDRLFPVDGRTPTERAATRAASTAAQLDMFTPADFATVTRGTLDACPVCASTEHSGRFGCPHGLALSLDLDDQADDAEPVDLDGAPIFWPGTPPEWRTECPHPDDRRRIEAMPQWLRDLNHDWQPMVNRPDINDLPHRDRLAVCPRRYSPQSANPSRNGRTNICIRCGNLQVDHPTEGDTIP